ncbi:aminotransferase class III-fold pyridoxal phosphate-dependent enzyme [Gemmobacter lanyuensis]
MTDPFRPLMVEMPKIPAPRAYLDGLDMDDPATGEHYAAMLEAKILAEGPDTVLAFIQEPVGGASTGALVPPAGYMQAVRRICDRYGILLIHDEVMSGGGRVGAFLGGDLWGWCRIFWRFPRGSGQAMHRWGPWLHRNGLSMRCRGGWLSARSYLCGQPAGLQRRSCRFGRDRAAGHDGQLPPRRHPAEGAA